MPQQHKIGTHATTVTGGYPNITVRYHQTEIVTVTPAGVRLHSGGWQTATTKTRMNQASNQYGLGFRVWQKDRAWYVTAAGVDRPFVDGMIIERTQ